jgi:hypothetical protein
MERFVPIRQASGVISGVRLDQGSIPDRSSLTPPTQVESDPTDARSSLTPLGGYFSFSTFTPSSP